MSGLFRHAMRHEWTDKNPITLVRQSAKRLRTPDVLDVQEIQALLSELEEPYRTMVFLASSTGLRVSELLALKWLDINFAAGEINLSRGIVRQRLGEMKTEAARKPIPLDPGLASVLLDRRARSPYNGPQDWLFASLEMKGSQPYWPNSAMENHIRPAAQRAGISKRIGWHTFRHSYRSWLDDTGAPLTVQKELMRHASIQTTMNIYGKAMTDSKRQAHSKVVEMVLNGSKPEEKPAISAIGS